MQVISITLYERLSTVHLSPVFFFFSPLLNLTVILHSAILISQNRFPKIIARNFIRTENFLQSLVFYQRGLVIHDLYLGREKHFILHMEISQLELKNQAATQMLFAFPTAALSGHTVDTSLLIFLEMTKSSTCPFRNLCGPNRTEYKASIHS